MLQPNNSGCKYEAKEIFFEKLFDNINYIKPAYISNNHNVSSTSDLGYHIKIIRRKNLKEYIGYSKKFGNISGVSDDKLKEISEWVSKKFPEVLGYRIPTRRSKLLHTTRICYFGI